MKVEKSNKNMDLIRKKHPSKKSASVSTTSIFIRKQFWGALSSKNASHGSNLIFTTMQVYTNLAWKLYAKYPSKGHSHIYFLSSIFPLMEGWMAESQPCKVRGKNIPGWVNNYCAGLEAGAWRDCGIDS